MLARNTYQYVLFFLKTQTLALKLKFIEERTSEYILLEWCETLVFLKQKMSFSWLLLNVDNM